MINREEEVQEYVIRSMSELKEIAEKNHVNEKRRRYLKKLDYFRKVWWKSGKHKADQANRRALMDSTYKTLSVEEKRKIYLFYKNRPLGFHVDHIVPLSRGGKHCLNNLQYLLAEENIKKGNRIVENAG